MNYPPRLELTRYDCPFQPKALVVDDEPLILMAAVEMIAAAGFSPGGFTSADEAMAILESGAEDVVLVFTDVEMPGSMDGLALARSVAERWPHIGLIVASCGVRPVESDLPGGAMFLPKPYSACDVEAVMARFAIARGGDRRDTRRHPAPSESMPFRPVPGARSPEPAKANGNERPCTVWRRHG